MGKNSLHIEVINTAHRRSIFLKLVLLEIGIHKYLSKYGSKKKYILEYAEFLLDIFCKKNENE